MDIGMIGLGKMGGNMSARVLNAGHRVVGFDVDDAARAAAVEAGAEAVAELRGLVDALEAPRVVWMMVPAPIVDTVLGDLAPHLAEGDMVVDGGNSRYTDTLRRAAELGAQGVDLVDVGTSGGIWGLTEGYSMMVGGDADVIERLRPIFEALAPSPDTGWGRVGPSGAGHFVKMVHNGIEYGLMEAYAEGFSILRAKEDFELDPVDVARIWRHGSVIRSWLLDLTAQALDDDPEMSGVAPFVDDSGEGRWTVQESIDLAVPAPVIALALMRRFSSRDEYGFSDRLVAAMRNQFGGHDVKEQ